MQTEELIGLTEVSRVTGIPYWRIIYAHRKGAIPWPARVVNTWAYGPEDVATITRYFAAKDRNKVA